MLPSAGISQDLWRLCHDGRRIAIIDDSTIIGERLRDKLAALYGEVVYFSDPSAALQEILRSARVGSPFDALVLDLHMEQLPGLSLLKELYRSHPTPVVISTGSMMADEVFRLSAFFDTEASCAKILQWCATEIKNIERPILFHHKFDTHDALDIVRKLDVAMLRMKDGIGDAHTFLEEFNPKLTPKSAESVLAHRLSQSVRAGAEIILEVISQLHADARFKPFLESSWWEKSGAANKAIVERLAQDSFTRITEDERRIGEYLHRMVTDLISLDPPPLATLDSEAPSSAQDAVLRSQLTIWERARRQCTGIAQAEYKAYRKLEQPRLELEALLIGQLGLSARVHCPYPSLEIEDQSKRIRTVLKDAIAIAQNRASKGSVAAEIEYIASIAEEGIPQSVRNRLSAIGCNNACRIIISDNAACKNLECAYESLAFSLTELEKTGEAVWHINRDDANRFSLYVNLNKVGVGNATGTPLIFTPTLTLEEEFWKNLCVTENLGSERNIIVVSEEFEGDLFDADIGDGVVYFRDGKIYVGFVDSCHVLAANHIARYLKTKGVDVKENFQIRTGNESEDVAAYLKRIGLTKGERVVEVTKAQGYWRALFDTGLPQDLKFGRTRDGILKLSVEDNLVNVTHFKLEETPEGLLWEMDARQIVQLDATRIKIKGRDEVIIDSDTDKETIKQVAKALTEIGVPQTAIQTRQFYQKLVPF